MSKILEAAAAFNAAPRVALVKEDQFEVLHGNYVGQVFATDPHLLSGKIEILKNKGTNLDKTEWVTYTFQTAKIAVRMAEKSALALVKSLQEGKLIDLLNCRFVSGKGTFNGQRYIRLAFPNAGAEIMHSEEGTSVQEVIHTQ